VQEVRGVVDVNHFTVEDSTHQCRATCSARCRTALEFSFVLDDHDVGESIDVSNGDCGCELKLFGLVGGIGMASDDGGAPP
jgi:hypothetical protein